MRVEPGKWTIELMVKPVADDGTASGRENIKVTMESAKNPCEGLQEFQPVELAGLEYNMMANERGQAMAFWRLRGLRPAGQAGQAAR